MAAEPGQTVGDLRREAIVTDDEITAATEAYLANPKSQAFAFASGHVLDVSAAVDAHSPTKAALAGQITSDAFRRSMVRTAVIMAVPAA